MSGTHPEATNMSARSVFAIAGQFDVNNRLRVWFPPKGRAYWVDTGLPNAGPALNERELILMRELARSRADNAALRELLEKLQWIRDPLSSVAICPVCGNEEQIGHASDCKIGAMLDKGTSA